MKKSVIVSIAVIYIIAIVVVGFIGMKMKVANALVPVEKIECVSEDAVKSTGDKVNEYDYSIKKNYTEGLKVEIKCQITPDNATQKRLEYIYDESKTDTYTLTVNPDGTATVSFYNRGSATIIVKATDNNGVNITIKILVR